MVPQRPLGTAERRYPITARSYVVPRMEAGLQAIGLSARVIATLDS